MIVGESPAIRQALARVDQFAPLGLPILLVGATGTGKDLLARHIHERSRRRGALVSVNCGVLPRDMADSLLFGHRRHAFTGASEAHVGHIERSHGGTLFLDELGSLSAEVQVKLLRVLDDGMVLPLGAGVERKVDLRIVAAAQDDLFEALADGRFREDLFQRLAGVVIRLPPLAERREDVVPLATYFAGLGGRVLEPGTAEALLNYSWPRNVRELRMAIERAGGMVENGTLPPAAIVEAIALGAVSGARYPVPILDVIPRIPPITDDEILKTCTRCDWDLARSLRALDVSRATLYRRLRRLGVSFRRQRKSHLSQKSQSPIETTENSQRAASGSL